MKPRNETRRKASTIKTKQKLKRSVRPYDNTARAEKSAETQKAILLSLVQLLVEKKGGEVTFEEIAKRTGISERTIFRFYGNKEELHRELSAYLVTYLKAGMEKISVMNVAAFAKDSFELFDRYEPLMLAYIYSSFGQEARKLFREKLNAAIIEKILSEKPVEQTETNKKRIAVIVSLINAKVWHDIKTDFGFNGAEIGDSIAWAVRTLIRALDEK